MYTYDDYLKKRDEYGFTADQISDADDRLAQMNPDAGMALLGFKNDWLTATNESAKAMAHAGAEDIRSRYGNYTGGGNGGSFVPTGTAQYEDPWETAVRTQIRNLENRKFEWSPETDPTVKYYEDAYRREGERAMKDTLGAVAATTGGIPSSYATAAAAQQRNYYAQQLTDKYPELYQQAFDRFMQEYDRDYQMLDVYNAQSEQGYGRWFDQQERDRQARQDLAAAGQQAFENQYMLDELALREDQNRIAWAELDMNDAQFTREMDYKYASLDQQDQQFVQELLYKYDVLNADNEYKWAALAQDGEIADKELQYKYDQLSEQAKQFMQELVFGYAEMKQNRELTEAELAQDQAQHEDNVRLTQEEMQIKRESAALAYAELSESKRKHIQEMAYNYAKLAEEARQWDDNTKISMAEIGLKQDQIKASESAENIELAFAAAEMGDFSLLRDLGLNVDSYEALWNMSMDEQLNPTEEDIVDLYMEQDEPEGGTEYPLETLEDLLYETGTEDSGSEESIPAHIQVIMQKQEKGQKLTESEKILWKQYKKSGEIAR